jgi:DNA polymerase III subunit gamma/tau
MTEQHEPLALKHRPQRFSDVAGQTASAAVLYQMARRRKLPPGMLFHGARGCGKTTTARILGMALNCVTEDGPAAEWPCGQCASCKAVALSNSPDVIELDAASNGSVDRIRELRTEVLYGSGGEWRVVIVDECHQMSPAAWDAFLKVLEEPPPQTLFLFLTTEFGKVPRTVRSRCMKFPFRPIPDRVILARLEHICQAEGIPAEPGLLAAITEAAEGGMRDAIMQLDQVTSVGITSLAMWRELTGERDFAPELLAAAVTGDIARAHQVLEEALCATGDYAWVASQLIRCLTDSLRLAAGGSVAAAGEALARRRELAAQAGPYRLTEALKVLWDLQAKVRVESKRDGLSLAVTMVCDRLCPAPEPRHKQANGHRPGTVAEVVEAFR